MNVVTRELEAVNSQLLNEELAVVPGYRGFASFKSVRGGVRVQVNVAPNADAADVAAIEALLLAHDPTQLSEQQQKAAAVKEGRDDAAARLQASALADKSPAEIYTLVQGQVDGITTLAEAKTFLRQMIPLLAAGVVWLAAQERQS